MGIIELLIYTLATWRVSSMLVNERGPGDMFLHLRELAGFEHDEDGIVTIIPETFIGGVLSCMWCCSVWVGLFFSAGALLWPLGAIWGATPLALSAGAILVEKILNG